MKRTYCYYIQCCLECVSQKVKERKKPLEITFAVDHIDSCTHIPLCVRRTAGDCRDKRWYKSVCNKGDGRDQVIVAVDMRPCCDSRLPEYI